MTIDDMTKRCKLTIENEKQDAENEIDDEQDTENMKRKFDTHTGSKKIRRTNLSLSEIRARATRGTYSVPFDSLFGSGLSRIPCPLLVGRYVK